MAWSGTYTGKIKTTLDNLANNTYQPQYDQQIRGTADKINNYGDYTSKYQPQIDDLSGRIGNYGSYQSKYQPQIDNYVDRLSNWVYDPETDTSYQTYKRQYTDLGNKAMRNTLGQVSARTGGLASSYAGSAAQQSYQDYMNQLSNIIPQLEQQAYNRAANNLNMLQSADNTAYGRWNDEFNRMGTQLGMYQNLDNTDYSRWNNALQDLYNRNSMYLGMDQNELARYNAMQQAGYDQLNAMWDYNDWEYQQYLADLAAAQAAAGGSGGGGGGGRGGSGGSGGSGNTGMTEEQLAREALGAVLSGDSYKDAAQYVKAVAANNGLTGSTAIKYLNYNAGAPVSANLKSPQSQTTTAVFNNAIKKK